MPFAAAGEGSMAKKTAVPAVALANSTRAPSTGVLTTTSPVVSAALDQITGEDSR